MFSPEKEALDQKSSGTLFLFPVLAGLWIGYNIAGIQVCILVSILMVSMMVLVAETVHLQFLIMMVTAAAVLDGR